LKDSLLGNAIGCYFSRCKFDDALKIDEMDSYLHSLKNLFTFLSSGASFELLYFTINIYNYLSFGKYDSAIFQEEFENFFKLLIFNFEEISYDNTREKYNYAYLVTLKMINLMFPDMIKQQERQEDDDKDLLKSKELRKYLLKLVNSPNRSDGNLIDKMDISPIKKGIEAFNLKDGIISLLIKNIKYIGFSDTVLSDVNLLNDSNFKVDKDYSHNVSELYHSSSTHFKENVNGIRQLRDLYEISDLIPSNQLFLEDNDVFDYMVATNSLISYEHSDQVIEKLDISVNFSFEALHDFNDVHRFKFPGALNERDVFLSTFVRYISFVYIYSLRQIVIRDPFISKNKFHFNYFPSFDNFPLSLDDVSDDFNEFILRTFEDQSTVLVNNFIEETNTLESTLKYGFLNDNSDGKKVILNFVLANPDNEGEKSALASYEDIYQNFHTLIFHAKVGNGIPTFKQIYPSKGKLLGVSEFLTLVLNFTIRGIYSAGDK
ncbi:MAG TPA: hypothetical protein PLQ59_09350, partial [Fervidobacterium sp.]|nr:hypothetical protein [Fervidobacterium sp.]